MPQTRTSLLRGIFSWGHVQNVLGWNKSAQIMCVHVGSVGSHRSTVAPGGFIQLVDPCPPPPYRRHPTPHLRLLLGDLAGGERTQVDLLVPYSRFERCRAPICWYACASCGISICAYFSSIGK